MNVFELAKKFIKAGAAGVHFEDQLASEKKCGHMGGKVLVPTGTMIKNLKAARLAADIADVPLIILARTDANAAALASVLARIIKGTSAISAANLAAFKFFIMVPVGTKTFPPI